MTRNTHSTKKESSNNMLSFVNNNGKTSFSIKVTAYDDQPLNCYGMAASSSSSDTGNSDAASQDSDVQDHNNIYTVQGKLPSGVEIKTMNKTSLNSLSHGTISVIGRRRSMEDAVTVAPGVVHLKGNRPAPISYDFYAVYDGNSAYTVARKCKERLHHVVAEQFLVFGLDEWDRVMSSSFARFDEECVKDEFGGRTSFTVLKELVGPTALVVLVGSEEIVVANCGDSKAVLSCNGAAVTLSRDPKLKRPNEKSSPVVTSVGGNVTCLNSAHVLGYRENREQNVLPAPEVTVHKRRKTDDFLVIASDGLWDVISNETACDIVRKCCLKEVMNRKVLEGVDGNYAAVCSAAMLVELALARGSKDNISVIVVELEHFTNADGNYQST